MDCSYFTPDFRSEWMHGLRIQGFGDIPVSDSLGGRFKPLPIEDYCPFAIAISDWRTIPAGFDPPPTADSQASTGDGQSKVGNRQLDDPWPLTPGPWLLKGVPRMSLAVFFAALILAPSLSSAPLQTESQSQPAAASEKPPAAQPSLGEIARQLRQKRAKETTKPAKVYTNDNLPVGGALSVVGPPAESAKEGQGASGPEKHGPEYYRAELADLQQKASIHQRELEVLQQKLGENQVQFYSNPNQILQQEYSRSDINKLTTAIDEKKQQVEDDQKAIADLQQQMASAGVSPELASGQVGGTPSPKGPDLSGVKKDSREYWQLRFQAAREALQKAKEAQQTTEDELTLLQSQYAHDVEAPNAASLQSQIAAKQSEVESARAATAKAQQDLDALQQEFDRSGAPADWIQ
jgi:hypothetical protein